MATEAKQADNTVRLFSAAAGGFVCAKTFAPNCAKTRAKCARQMGARVASPPLL